MASDTRDLGLDREQFEGFEFEARASGPYREEGYYVATVLALEPLPPSEKNPNWGPQLKWHLAMAYEDTPDAYLRKNDGEIKTMTPLTSRKTGKGSNASYLINALLGRKLGPTEKPSPRELIGKKMLIEVVHEAKGDKVYGDIDFQSA